MLIVMVYRPVLMEFLRSIDADCSPVPGSLKNANHRPVCHIVYYSLQKCDGSVRENVLTIEV